MKENQLEMGNNIEWKDSGNPHCWREEAAWLSISKNSHLQNVYVRDYVCIRWKGKNFTYIYHLLTSVCHSKGLYALTFDSMVKQIYLYLCVYVLAAIIQLLVFEVYKALTMMDMLNEKLCE